MSKEAGRCSEPNERGRGGERRGEEEEEREDEKERAEEEEEEEEKEEEQENFKGYLAISDMPLYL